MLAKLVSKVEGIINWGARIDQKIDEATTSNVEMKACLNMVLLVQKALAKKLGVLLPTNEGELLSNESMHKSEVQQGQQLTLALGGVCQNTSCGDLDGVVQNYEIVATTTTTCTNIKIRKQH
jgi:hypothetical protein